MLTVVKNVDLVVQCYISDAVVGELELGAGSGLAMLVRMLCCQHSLPLSAARAGAGAMLVLASLL